MEACLCGCSVSPGSCTAAACTRPDHSGRDEAAHHCCWPGWTQTPETALEPEYVYCYNINSGSCKLYKELVKGMEASYILETTTPNSKTSPSVLVLIQALASILWAATGWYLLAALLILQETVRQLSAQLHHWLIREEVQTVQSCEEPLIVPEG